ncbi:MAG TPA: NAD(P)H-dependent oxidoreductase [Mycobacteriales bacterium]|nr:NAD(P)H-dependent oxidoreductase [Mycobacteriales bacterium]
MTLLHVTSSIRQDGSVSREVAATFLKHWQDAHPGDTVVHRDLGTDPLPYIGIDELSLALAGDAERTPSQASAAALQQEIGDEVLAADAYLIATPLYNWTIPSRLQSWVDRLLANHGLWNGGQPLAGRPAVVITAKGGTYGPGTPREGWDHAEPYLRRILADVFGLETTFVSAELTLAGVNPAMAGLLDQRDDSLRAAHAAAASHARRIAVQAAA